MKLVLLVGPSGSGKSTWAATQEACVISLDDIRSELGHVDDKSNDELAYHLAASRVCEAVALGESVIVDTTNLKQSRYLPIVEAALDVNRNTEICYKVFSVSPQVAFGRIQAQLGRGEQRANVPMESIQRHAKALEATISDMDELGFTRI